MNFSPALRTCNFTPEGPTANDPWGLTVRLRTAIQTKLPGTTNVKYAWAVASGVAFQVAGPTGVMMLLHVSTLVRLHREWINTTVTALRKL